MPTIRSVISYICPALIWAVLLPKVALTEGDGLYVSDFIAYFTASEILASEQVVYDHSRQKRTQSRLLDSYLETDATQKELLPYLYPPASLMMVHSLHLLDLETSYLAWQTLNLILFLICVRLLLHAGWQDLPPVIFTAFLVCASIAWYKSFLLAQLSPLLLLAVWYAAPFQRAVHPAAYLPIAAGMALKPHLMLYPFIAALSRRRGLGLLSAAGILWLSSLMLYGTDSYLAYAEFMLSTLTSPNQTFHFGRMLNLHGLLTLFTPSPLAESENVPAIGFIILTVYLAGGALIYYLWRQVEADKLSGERAWAWTLILTCLLSPWQHQHDNMLLLLPLLHICRHHRVSDRPWIVPGLCLYGALFMFEVAGALKLLVYPLLTIGVWRCRSE